MKSFTVKHILILLLTLIFIPALSGQSFDYRFNNDKSTITIEVKDKSTKGLLKGDADRKLGRPLKIGRKYDLFIDNAEVGVWKALPEGNVWTFDLKATDSRGIILNFDDFYIPQGAYLYVYQSDDDANPLLFTHSNNPEGGAYSIESYTSDKMRLKYVEPSGDIAEIPRLKVSSFGYKADDVYISGFNRSGPCMININCQEGKDWQEQKKGIVRMRTNLNGIYYACTGTLINNVNEDRTPYILTAAHCFNDQGVIGTAKDISETEFFFDYEFSGCENETERPSYNYIKGADSLMISLLGGGSDAAFLKINESLPLSWNVYFNGWNTETKDYAINAGAVIHHPSGDVKKISFFDNGLYTDSWTGSIPKVHWATRYSEGSTEEGSSGAPLFDNEGLVIGSLTGGNSNCSNAYGKDLYSKFGYNFDKDADADKQLKKYLDPDDSGVEKLSGWDGFDKKILFDRSSLDLDMDETVRIRITSGNGDYQIKLSDESVVAARINELDKSQIIVTAGNTAGNATIKVSDRKNEENTIAVKVHSTTISARAPDIFVSWNETSANVSDKNMLYVRAKRYDDVIKKIRVVNLKGNVVFEKDGGFENNRYDVDTSAWSSGLLYLVIVESQKASKTYKIIK